MDARARLLGLEAAVSRVRAEVRNAQRARVAPRASAPQVAGSVALVSETGFVNVSPQTMRGREVPQLALSPDEAAASLGVSRDYLDEHIAAELRWVRRGRRKFVSVVELERWLEKSGALTLGGTP